MAALLVKRLSSPRLEAVERMVLDEVSGDRATGTFVLDEVSGGKAAENFV